MSNQVVVVWQGNPTDENDVPELGSYVGYVTRVFLTEREWVRMTSDKTLRPPPEED